MSRSDHPTRAPDQLAPWIPGTAYAVAALLAVTLIEAPAAPVQAAPPAATPAKQACPAERPDEAAARVTARLCGDKVKIASMTNEYDEAWALPNGTVNWEHRYRPVRVQRDKTWVPVDTTLFVDTDGKVRPKAAAVDLAFSGGGSDPMVTVAEDATTVQLGSPVGALPEPVLDGDTVTYPEVLPGVDLQLRADVEGYAQVLVVKDRKAAVNPKLKSLRFPLTSKGLKVSTDTAGNFQAKDPRGEVRFAGHTPLMWDAPAQEAAEGVRNRVGKTKAMGSKFKGGALTVTPDQAMLTDPATEFPIYIDPTVQAARSAWTMVNSGAPTTSYWNNSGYAKVGTNNGGTNKYRSFFNLNVNATPIAGKHIIDAKFFVWQLVSPSCTARQTDLWSTGVATSAATWNNQPAWGTLQGSNTTAHGYSSACPQAAVGYSAVSNVRAAADGKWTNVTLALRSPNETDNSYYREFSNNPVLNIGYTSYPTITSRATVPSTSCVTGSGRPYIKTARPVLKTRVTDPEGAAVRPEIEWSAVGGSKIGAATPGGAASGTEFSATVPAGAFFNGGSYSWRVRGYDSAVWGPWTGNCEFTVDTAAPSAAPAVTSAAYPAGAWSGVPGTAGSFTVGAAGVSDVAAYLYGLDAEPTTQVVPSALGGTATFSVTPATEGPHTLKVRSRDRAGNLSPVTSYDFNVGNGAVIAPTTGLQSAGKVTLDGVGKSTSTGIGYQWRRGDADAWVTIPAGDVTTTGGAAITWPVATTGTGAYPELVWDAAKTVNDAEAGTDPLNGPVQVRATFSGTTSGTSSGVSFTLDRDRTEAASDDVGPGSVNLLTGNYSVSESDLSTIGGLGLSRTFNTRIAGEVDPLFGPGWTSGVSASEASTYTEVRVTGSLVQVGLADGTELGFTKKAVTSTGATFTPEVGAEGYVLNYTTSGDTYQLIEPSADRVTFSNQSAGLYVPTSLTAAGTTNGSKISWEKVTVNGVSVVRPTGMVAKVPDGIASCATMVRGCQSLTFSYATATTATSTVSGDYLGRLKQVSLTAWDPDLPTPALRTVVMAQYGYDNAGRLRSAWDPRLDYTGLNGPLHVARSYTYNADGTLATLTPPGEEPWQFTYTTLPADSGTGRLYKVTRSALAAGTAVETVVYNMPISGSNASVNMASSINRWGQEVLPVDATAVYPADIVPDGNPAAGTLPTNTNDDRSTVTYMDANGRSVNTMYPGGAIDATWYDVYGNQVRVLEAGNLESALLSSESDSIQDEAEAALRESTLYTYSGDGQRLLGTLAPERDTALADGNTVRGSTQTLYIYNEGAPSDAAFSLSTTTTQALRYQENGVLAEAQKLTTKTTYDWTRGQPVKRIVDPTGLEQTTWLAYDSAGNQTSVTTPAGNAEGTTPSTQRTVYYRAGTGSGYSECDSRPEWAGLVCRTQTGAQPPGLEIPVEVTTYDLFGQPRDVINKTSGTTLRTTTINYDAGGRESTVSTSSSLGTAVEKRKVVYDAATGAVSKIQTMDGSGSLTGMISQTHDTLGRQTAYTDAEGNTSTTGYDLLSRPISIFDGKGTQTVTYNGGGEKRGLPTQVIDSEAGTFTAVYNARGGIDTEVRPDGVAVKHSYNEVGSRTGVEYRTSCETDTCSLYSNFQGSDAHGRVMWDVSSLSESDYRYDNAGRSTSVLQKTSADCALRVYAFDKASNRTGLTTYGSDSEGQCRETNAATSRSWTYDTADRVNSPSHVYDALGRTLTVPASDVASGAGDVTVGYYANDMVRSIAQGSTQGTYALDVVPNRIRAYTVTSGSNTSTKVNHYSDESDSPSWIEENSSYTRRITGIAGVAAYYNGAATRFEWQFANLHGDIVAMRAGDAAGLSSTYVTDEYGRYVAGGNARYGYLGAEQRSADNPAGLITMGVRLYNPATGRFLSTDPVYGGNANSYDYCSGSPANCSDVSGQYSIWYSSCKKSWRTYDRKGSVRGWNGNIRCDFGHGWFTSGNYVLTSIFGAIGAALGALWGGPWGAFAGAIIGGIGGGYLGWWYSTYCKRSDGAQLRGTIKVRWHRWLPSEKWNWGYPLGSKCH